MRNRQYIPTMPAAPAPSLWQRLRGAASAVAATIRSVSARVAAIVVRKVTGARAAVSRVARAAMVRRPWVLTRDGAQYAVTRASSWCRTTWRRVIRPFMRVRIVVLGIGVVVVGLAVVPVATLATLAVCGAALIGLSHAIARLEASSRSVAGVVLRMIETVAQVLYVAAYVAAGVAVLAISAVSAAFAVTEVLELVLRYFDVPLAAALATLGFFVLTASWGFAIGEIVWLAMVYEEEVLARSKRFRSADRRTMPMIRIDADRAWDGDKIVHIVPGSAEPLATNEEIQDTMDMIDKTEPQATKCVGCDLDDASPRFSLGSMTLLCRECFACLVDDELILAADRGEVSAEDVIVAIRAGISVPAYVVIASGARLRSTRIDLDREAITCRTGARAQSEQDPSRVYWAETGWWFDGRGGRRARRWHGFVAGRVATSVEYRHERDVRGFYTQVGDVRFKTLSGAQDAAADEIADRAYENNPVAAAAAGSHPRVAGAVP